MRAWRRWYSLSLGAAIASAKGASAPNPDRKSALPLRMKRGPSIIKSLTPKRVRIVSMVDPLLESRLIDALKSDGEVGDHIFSDASAMVAATLTFPVGGSSASAIATVRLATFLPPRQSTTSSRTE